MSIFKHYATQHQDSVAYVFKKYGVKAPVTPRNIALAILAGKDSNFYRDLQNAIAKRSLGHNNYEDEYNYYLVDMDDDSFDGEVVGITDAFELDYLDRSGRKAKKKQKKIVKKAKKADKKAAKSAKRGAAGATGTLADAELVADDGGGSGSSVADKIQTGMNIVGSLAEAAGGIASQFTNKGNTDNPGDASGTTGSQRGTYTPPEESGIKKYLPYIIGGLALTVLVGGLIFYLKRKSK